MNGRLNMNFESPFKKIKIYVDAPEIADAMEWQSDEGEGLYYLDLETGEVIYFTSDVLEIVESEDGVQSTLHEWRKILNQ
jgi:hypothetical protein